MIEIPLTQGKVALIDDADFELISARKWCVRWGRNTFYAGSRIKGTLVKMQNYLLHPPKGMIVDHRNHNGLDNRRLNLRICTQTENMRNSLSHKDGSSKYKGVSFCKFTGKWRVQIHIDGKNKNAGRYLSEIEAAHAYDSIAEKVHGEFACLNRDHFEEIN